MKAKTLAILLFSTTLLFGVIGCSRAALKTVDDVVKQADIAKVANDDVVKQADIAKVANDIADVWDSFSPGFQTFRFAKSLSEDLLLSEIAQEKLAINMQCRSLLFAIKHGSKTKIATDSVIQSWTTYDGMVKGEVIKSLGDVYYEVLPREEAEFMTEYMALVILGADTNGDGNTFDPFVEAKKHFVERFKRYHEVYSQNMENFNHEHRDGLKKQLQKLERPVQHFCKIES